MRRHGWIGPAAISVFTKTPRHKPGCYQVASALIAIFVLLLFLFL